MFSLNRSRHFGQPIADRINAALGASAPAAVLDFISNCPIYTPTPLVALDNYAKQAEIASLHVKDESARLGLGSFKALGGAYAVARLVADIASVELGRAVSSTELLSDEIRSIAARITVACATDGNHGRSVAAGARLLGAQCEIFVHEGVSPLRVAAMAQLGAHIRRVEGTYDDSVAAALVTCVEKGWHVVSDTSWPGYEDIPLSVMQGYTLMIDEALSALEQSPTHVFLQAGVGGYAAAAAAFLKNRLGDQTPTIVIVEPDKAACLYASMLADAVVSVPHGQSTVMAMLECYKPSLVAWDVLSRLADAFMTVKDEDAIAAMRRFAKPEAGDDAIVAGESGGVGLAALETIIADRALAVAIGLGPDSRVLLFNTEGATDPGLYQSFVGETDGAVSAHNECQA